MRPRVRILLPALVAVLALPLGCTKPSRPGGVAEDFRTPDAVLVTMAAAIGSKSSSGGTAWVDAFAESTHAGDRAYRQYYDGAVKASWQAATSFTAPEPWNKTLERGLPPRLFVVRSTFTYTYQWGQDVNSPADGDPNAADTVEFHRHYVLLATPPNGSNPEIIGAGYCDLSFQKTNGRWSIFRWHDRVDPAYGVSPSGSEYSMSRHRLDSLIH
jgi:hypothetical protein